MAKKKQADKPPEEFEDIKWCDKCREWKAASEFYKRYPQRYYRTCKACAKVEDDIYHAKQTQKNRSLTENELFAGDKWCPVCMKTKDKHSFLWQSSSTAGLYRSCRPCCKAYYDANKEKIAARAKLYREANKDEKKKLDATYYIKNKEKVKARVKKYAADNKEMISKKGKAYRGANKEKIKAYQKAYYEANKEKASAYSAAYRAANKERINNERRKKRLISQTG